MRTTFFSLLHLTCRGGQKHYKESLRLFGRHDLGHFFRALQLPHDLLQSFLFLLEFSIEFADTVADGLLSGAQARQPFAG